MCGKGQSPQQAGTVVHCLRQTVEWRQPKLTPLCARMEIERRLRTLLSWTEGLMGWPAGICCCGVEQETSLNPARIRRSSCRCSRSVAAPSRWEHRRHFLHVVAAVEAQSRHARELGAFRTRPRSPVAREHINFRKLCTCIAHLGRKTYIHRCSRACLSGRLPGSSSGRGARQVPDPLGGCTSTTFGGLIRIITVVRCENVYTKRRQPLGLEARLSSLELTRTQGCGGVDAKILVAGDRPSLANVELRPNRGGSTLHQQLVLETCVVCL